jgi:Protein of unknown function with HXXEE motif
MASSYIFAIHNMEELAHLKVMANEIPDDSRFSILHDLYQFNNVAVAMMLLTLTVGIIISLEYKKRTFITFHLTILCTCLLLINGIAHVWQFILHQGYVPGLISTIFLMIPYMAYIISLFVKNNNIKMRTIILYLVFSMITIGPIIVLFLLISSIIKFGFINLGFS